MNKANLEDYQVSKIYFPLDRNIWNRIRKINFEKLFQETSKGFIPPFPLSNKTNQKRENAFLSKTWKRDMWLPRSVWKSASLSISAIYFRKDNYKCLQSCESIVWYVICSNIKLFKHQSFSGNASRSYLISSKICNDWKNIKFTFQGITPQ